LPPGVRPATLERMAARAATLLCREMPRAAEKPVFTPRERDVLRGVKHGLTNKEIAESLGLNEQSVKNLLSVVYEKCHVRNRLELALYALRQDL
jgi:DNA-binding NarL/FixJ family response regulator